MWIRAESLQEVRQRLRAHAIYRSLRTREDLLRFTEHHVVCVLDFMSLLKSLQRELSCVDVPWTPARDPELARWITEIVLDEESDLREDGRAMSHFEWYVEAMREIGADTSPVLELVDALRSGRSWGRALRASRLPEAARAFGEHSASVLAQPLHVRAAVFCHGREEIIPELFLPIVDELTDVSCPALRGYLQRHIDVDGGDHGPRAAQMLERVYAGDAKRREEGERAAIAALQVRERLWDALATGQCPVS